jgi:hypothetical protein
MKLWIPKKRGQHGRDPKLAVVAIAVALGLLAMAFWLGSQV